MKISNIKISDIKSLSDAVIEANERFDGQIWWRGQGNFDWDLLPSVFRITNHGERYEGNIIKRFRQRAPARHPKTPSPKDYFGWLFLMQHYRLPTRLLDWTESPLYAAFFATEDDHNKERNGGLYALQPYILNQMQVGKYGVWAADNESGFHLIKKAFGIETSDVDFVLAISPPETDIRMMMQLSSFTIHGSGKSIDDLPDTDEFLIKFEILSDAKSIVLEQLKHLGVRESNLFPDLEHLSKELSPLVFSDFPNDENVKDSKDAPPLSYSTST